MPVSSLVNIFIQSITKLANLHAIVPTYLSIAVRGPAVAAQCYAIADIGPADGHRFVLFLHLSSVVASHVLQAKEGQRQPASTVSDPTEALGRCLLSLLSLHGNLPQVQLYQLHAQVRSVVSVIDQPSFSLLAAAGRYQNRVSRKTKYCCQSALLFHVQQCPDPFSSTSESLP